MDALVMCGGRGTRLDAPVEKPLLEVCGEPMIDGVLAGLADSSVDRVHAAVSPHTPETARHLRLHALDPAVLETPGEGYVADLQVALEAVGAPVVSVAADLPLLASAHVERAMGAARRDRTAESDGTAASVGVAASVTVCVPASLKRRLGASVDATLEDGGRELAPTGLNVVGDRDDEALVVADDPRLAANVNRPADVPVAEALCD